VKASENDAKNITRHRNSSKTHSSPIGLKIELPKSQFHGDRSALYILRNAPVEVLESAGQIFIFRQVESQDGTFNGHRQGDCDKC